MFTNKERRMLGEPYFTVLREQDNHICIMSKCTKHCWIITKKSALDNTWPITIYHKHKLKDPYYHEHWHTYSVGKAVDSIKSHDDYVLAGKNY